MKKLGTILFFAGLIGVLSSALLRLLNISSRDLFFISDVLFKSGIILYLLFGKGRSKKYTLRQKIFLNIVVIGIVMLLIGHIMRYLHRDEYSNFLMLGYGLILLYVLYFAVIIIEDKLRINPRGKLATVETLSHFGLTIDDLDKYEGVYVNGELPLKITVTRNDITLIAQATNQSAFYLEVVERNVFKYYGRDIVLEFDVEKDKLLLKQHGGYFPFLKEP